MIQIIIEAIIDSKIISFISNYIAIFSTKSTNSAEAIAIPHSESVRLLTFVCVLEQVVHSPWAEKTFTWPRQS